MQKRRNVLILAPTKFEADPRHEDWAVSFVENGYDVSLFEFIGINPYPVSNQNKKRLGFKSERREYESWELISSEASIAFANEVANSFAINSSKPVLATEVLGKFMNELNSKNSFTHDYYLQQFLRMFAAVQNALLDFENPPEIVIANDLISAFSSLGVLGSQTKVFYDAQEIFTEMIFDTVTGPISNREREFWVDLETSLCKLVSSVVTVSPGIAELYQVRHQTTCHVIPNFQRIPNGNEGTEKTLKILSHNDPVKFVYMGGAAAHRGIDELIANWNISSTDGNLSLYIPDSGPARQLRDNLETKISKNPGISITWEAPVHESAMRSTLRTYDVGIIPYNYPYPYSHCSPNKLGQYISEGLAVLANEQPFVAGVVREHDIGRVFDWNLPGSFDSESKKMINRENLGDQMRNSRNAFVTAVNWNYYFSKWREDVEIQQFDHITCEGVPIRELRSEETTSLIEIFDNQYQSIAKRLVNTAVRMGVYENKSLRLLVIKSLNAPFIGRPVRRLLRTFL